MSDTLQKYMSSFCSDVLEAHQLGHPALNLPLHADKTDKKPKCKPSSVMNSVCALQAASKERYFCVTD